MALDFAAIAVAETGAVAERRTARLVDANVNFGTDAYANMAAGKPGAYMFGHGASLKDPYAAFDLFHSHNSKPIGTTADSAPPATITSASP